ncbi:thiolase C-terminal domain-containing protein [Humitalea sp. 24SJ18S-53]|uniref:thiolase C-terminal domain-containing protein n=1 Tax=Humitalea sp. 24SJ18S-53 TaxID=3422307 RepID=UPI003D6695CA
MSEAASLLRRAAIAGIGQSEVGRVPSVPTLELQRRAATAALEDCGLTFADIDGLLTTPCRVEDWAMPCAMVAEELGLRPRYLATLDVAGASGASMVHHAAMAVATGQAKAVLCVGGQDLLSHGGRSSAIGRMAGAGWAHPEFEAPTGPLVPTLYALIAQRHMHEFGTTPEQMAEVAVAMRGYAALNPAAHKQAPISIADVLASPMATTPLHMLDCAVVSDGAAAVIVTTAEHARDLRQRPIALRGQGYGYSHTYVGEYPTVTTTGAVDAGREAFRQAGVTPADIDIAELYDCFTITVIVELEDLGFCKKGEGGAFVTGGRIGPGSSRRKGGLPVTTHGGLLSAGHFGTVGGMLHVLEGVRQLRGQAAARQVPDTELVLVHGNGGIIGLHCTLILGHA